MAGEDRLNQPASATGLKEALETTVVTDLDADPKGNAQWDAFVASSPHGHLLQTSHWGTLKAHFGWKVERLVLMDEGKIVAGALVHYRSLPLGVGRLAYVPMGPVVDWDNEELVFTLLATLRQAVQRRRSFSLKIEPSLLEAPAQMERLARCGFAPASQTVQWKSTILIDLDCTEDEIMARFNKKHRQKLRKAAREGVVVRNGSAADLSGFLALLEETAGRKEFATYPAEYYKAAYDTFANAGRVQLLLAEYRNVVLAGLMVFKLGPKAYCMYAASGNAHRRLMPTYLLHWEGIRWAHAQGCVVYDYCGIPDEVGQDPDCHAHGDRHDGLWGVYRFKRGFGGQVVCYIGTHDQVYRRSLYSLYNHAIAFLENRLGETWNRRFFSG